MDTPEALEKQVHRIHQFLVRSHEDVTWNDHIPDPDNPKQSRQIDITIRQNGQLTLVECRLSRRRQDVKWIEELIGRRPGSHRSSVWRIHRWCPEKGRTLLRQAARLQAAKRKRDR
ncbi:MAG TPA: hypothetical protein VGK64_06160 [Bryobacteraceae bacterium]